MVWLSKDFEAERKWKLSQAKKVALRASKGMSDQATRGEERLKEEEHRMRKVALNISKDKKKFWLKIEKLVHYKHQLELEEGKKKALDKQLKTSGKHIAGRFVAFTSQFVLQSCTS
ncbi:Helicase/SANT-associated domain [Dillenia turbinata]|uniref:Helicase/SANT-associated domain n=1 Tax=Dillenia turbinata TaxID=194707 RepID=A0AAN8ZBF8_9MAGN